MKAEAALKCSYRFFANTNSVEGHTFEVKWIQEINQQLSLTPYVRYYRQSEADFYYTSLEERTLTIPAIVLSVIIWVVPRYSTADISPRK